MIRALWFMAKLGLVTWLAVFLVRQPGKVSIEWQGYLIETSFSFLLVSALLVMVLWTLFYRLWRGVVNVPAVYRRYKIATGREKGYRAVTEGLVAVAAGDAQGADKYARRAENMIPGMPLTRLLTAQAALMNGNAPKARREFTNLLEDGSAAFFGVRGLLNETLSEGNYREALDLARRAETLQPRRVWVVRTLFDLETRNREWLRAEKTLRKAEKLGIYSKDDATHHRQAIWTALAGESMGTPQVAIRYCQSALGLGYGFTPAAVLLARLYDAAGDRKSAIRTVEKAWAANPHPALSTLWAAYAPEGKKGKVVSVYDAHRDVYDWFRKLYDLNPQHRDSMRALGSAATQARLWKEARELLMKAMDYRALAKLERAETGNEARAREWLEQAAENPPDSRWVCTQCGSHANDWSALCPRCGSFDRLAWLTPSVETHDPQRRIAGMETGLISPPVSL